MAVAPRVTPRAENIARIPGALKFYMVMAYITGTFLLLLVTEMILKYMVDAKHGGLVMPGGSVDPVTGKFAFYEPGYELEFLGPHGFLSFVTAPEMQGVNLSTGILIVHGWLYVVYLFSGFRLWSLMRWPARKFLIIALGGVVPVMSFIVENIYGKEVKAFLATTNDAKSKSTTTSEAQK